MKTQILRIGGLGLLLAGVVALTGSSNTPSVAVVATNSPPATASNAAPDLLTYQPAPEVVQVANNAVAVTNEDKVIASATLPADVQFSPNFAEVTKLIQAGVNESVVRSFISNTSGTFNLNSDKIVYLNDLGVSGEVILAMMEHDRAWNSADQSAPVTATATSLAAENADNLIETAEASAVEYAQPTAVVVPQQPVTVNYFYDTLSPYGNWIEVEGYGRCWQPIIVLRQPLWQPYCDNGRWVYTDYGWYWASDYSWGATFHYGRWFRHHRRGWCWAPDMVWAPAWVSWRSSSDYCGWAPLPPGTGWIPGVGFGYRNHAVGFGFDFGLTADCFTFVRYDHFSNRHVGRHAMPRHEAARVINQTTVVNNFVQGNNNTIINHGVPPARVAAATGRQVNPVPISQVTANRPGDGPWHRGRPGLNGPAVSPFSHGGWSARPGNDGHRSPGTDASGGRVGTSPFATAPATTPNPDSSDQHQRPGNLTRRPQIPNRPEGQFRGRPDSTTVPSTTVQTPAAQTTTVTPGRTPPQNTAPRTGSPADTTMPSPWAAIGGQRERPANPIPAQNATSPRPQNPPSQRQPTVQTAPVAATTPTIAPPQVERHPNLPSRTQVVVPRNDMASQPRVNVSRVKPDESPRQPAVIERPQFQSPPAGTRPQILPQAPAVSAPQLPSRSLEHSVPVTRNNSPSGSTDNRGQRSDQDSPGQQRGRR